MTYKHKDTEVTGSRIVKEITFENENGDRIVIQKWLAYSDVNDCMDDSDENVIEGKEFWDKLSDEEQDELTDIVSEEFNK